ncbi:MAG TPA: DPP IV N-terminal domain-containing protein [Methylomirabilota bacterium]|nr:DPP IV N-terminal domain-containing protein [Methylomirabilota bacterium]
MDRIFASDEFKEERPGPVRWSRRTPDYFTLEAPAAGGPGRDLVRNDPATGRREIVVPASAFIPEGKAAPLRVESFEFSADETKMLLYTDSQRVWRRNTRGDYWVLDVATRALRRLGGDAAPSTLMFAKFSPDASRVAYVRENNLYVQELRGMRITALTTDGSATRINGTSDWVNEEELDIRDGFRWSPDGRRIAFWQFDTSGVRQFHLIDNTAGNYPRITSFPYPKVGETNSATRVGVVAATGGKVRWLQIPGDPREHYVPHLDWTPDGAHLVLQQFNRLQNTNLVMVADPRTGATRVALRETDAAWVDNLNPFRWVNPTGGFVWLSERDGWRHAYLAGLDGQQLSRITSGNFDVIDIEAQDNAGGWLYYAASPENPTQRYLYRTRLAGGPAERVTPEGQSGWHTYDISPDCRWAVHTFSTFTTPPVVDVVSLARSQGGACAGGQPEAARETVRAEAALDRVPENRHWRKRFAGCVAHHAAGNGSVRQTSVVHLRLWRAGRADGEGLVERVARLVALDARATGLPGGQRGQPRHGRAPPRPVTQPGTRHAAWCGPGHSRNRPDCAGLCRN